MPSASGRAHIALVVATDSQSTAYHSIFASGLIIFSLTTAVNLALRWLRVHSFAQGLNSHEK
jgi:hypothetical protein